MLMRRVAFKCGNAMWPRDFKDGETVNHCLIIRKKTAAEGLHKLPWRFEFYQEPAITTQLPKRKRLLFQPSTNLLTTAYGSALAHSHSFPPCLKSLAFHSLSMKQTFFRMTTPRVCGVPWITDLTTLTQIIYTLSKKSSSGLFKVHWMIKQFFFLPQRILLIRHQMRSFTAKWDKSILAVLRKWVFAK